MLPLEACWTEVPQSSSAFCSGCEGGTQCEILSSKVFSWASAGAASASPVAARISVPRSHDDCIDSSLRVSDRSRTPTCSVDGAFFAIQTQLAAEVKKLVGYKTNLRR